MTRLVVNVSTSEKAPEGRHEAVCLDVEDLGQVETAYGTKAMISISWQLNGGERLFVVRRRYTRSLHARAMLRKTLDSWRGVPVSPVEERDGIDLMQLVGKTCQVEIKHAIKTDGDVWANVEGVFPPGAPTTTPPPDITPPVDAVPF